MKKAKKKSDTYENDWLYSCPSNMDVNEIISYLGLDDQPITEFSGKNWQTSGQMANEFLSIYKYPSNYQLIPDQAISQDSLEEWVLSKAYPDGHLTKGHFESGGFVGETVIIRDSFYASVNVLALFLSAVQTHINRAQKNHFDKKIVVVLEGWIHSTLEGRTNRHVVWKVSPIPE